MVSTPDSMPTLWPVEVSFVPGEQPTDVKFTGLASQTEAAINRLTKAVGDLWGSRHGINYLSQPNFPTGITNLARVIGSMGHLNPIAPSPLETVTCTFDQEDIPEGVNQFNLRLHCGVPPWLTWDPSTGFYVPYHWGTELEDVLNDIDATVFATQKYTRAEVITTGDYHIDVLGTITTYKATGNYSSQSRSYETVLASDLFPKAGMNMIPHPADTSGQRCSIEDNGDGSYDIVLPQVAYSSMMKVDSTLVECGATTTYDVPPEAYNTRLPDVIVENFSSDQVLPDGFIYLWDHTNDDIVEHLTFTYQTEYIVKASGAELVEDDNRYSLIITGSSLAQIVGDLSRRFYSHDHNIVSAGRHIDHSTLLNNNMSSKSVFDRWGITVYTPPSRLSGNDHPQYLCRYGWKDAAGENTALCSNAMLGDLFMAAALSDYSSGTYTGSMDSRKIYFGQTTRYLNYQQTKTGLTLSGTHLILNSDGEDRYLKFYNTVSARTLLQIGYDSSLGRVGIFSVSPSISSIWITTASSSAGIYLQAAGGISLTAATTITLSTATNKPSLTLGTDSFVLTTGGTGTTGSVSAQTSLSLSGGTTVTVTATNGITLQTANTKLINISAAKEVAIPTRAESTTIVGLAVGSMFFDPSTDKLWIYRTAGIGDTGWCWVGLTVIPK